MLFIVRVFEDDEVYEYEYGCIEHAESHYGMESRAQIIEYSKGIETVIKEK